MKKVIVIVGPTASGKSKLAVSLAKAYQGEIINGDSVQVYRQLNIGSAKIKPDEMQGVPHHLLDIREPNEPYSVYHFQQDVRKKIEQIHVPFIVGGTGLYIKAALYDYHFTHEKRDNHFENQYDSYTTEQLADLLKTLDPDLVIKEYNRRRLLRAIHMAKSGEPRSKKLGKDTLLYDALILYLDIDRSTLNQRLRERLKIMFEQGFLEEAYRLYTNNIQVNAIGYREMNQYFNGELTLDEAKERIIIHSRQLAKKQKTWFLNQMHAHQLDAMDPHLYQTAHPLIQAFLKGE